VEHTNIIHQHDQFAEMMPLIHAQWLRQDETQQLLRNIESQKSSALLLAMNLAESGKATTEQLLIPLIKAKTLNDLITYVKETSESIVKS
jgi:hypothetical protein